MGEPGADGQRVQGIVSLMLDLELSMNTINWEIFVVKISSDSMASVKIKHTKIMQIINDNAVRGRLSENYLTRKFIARNICDAKYLRFTVFHLQHACMFLTIGTSWNARRQRNPRSSGRYCKCMSCIVSTI